MKIKGAVWPGFTDLSEQMDVKTSFGCFLKEVVCLKLRQQIKMVLERHYKPIRGTVCAAASFSESRRSPPPSIFSLLVTVNLWMSHCFFFHTLTKTWSELWEALREEAGGGGALGYKAIDSFNWAPANSDRAHFHWCKVHHTGSRDGKPPSHIFIAECEVF